ncbi:hypothetical protein HFO33_35180 [Rhizobium leguminosarum]|uniref:hypothetical protein n=1 Tax=Rhizobium leguminosarum TaxID=384 RepID=UPI001C95680A|nr:hypothetical protein [Rhizobium leguminosarum]MBY5667456.1 hypothetical protein [Rhizobium leguminosarum]MBY5709479.1 hypothetical protein [Rhizobium leguminosarum]MBY5721738.1 hypothetical protein [Rhizobium leguminosarum]
MTATKGKPSLQVSYNLDQIVRAIQLNGGSMSRTKLRNHLQLSDDELNAALDHGCNEKFLQKGEYNIFAVKKPFTISEERFYHSVEIGLKRLWAIENFHENEFYLEETAQKDSKIAGRWTRPDFTMISHKKFAWTIGHEFDVVTFEVKRPDSCNVLAVFEALSHATAATRAYVVFPIDASEWAKSDPAQEARVKDECSRHGVGLILIENVYIDPQPVHVIKAVKREIDHERCSSFLAAVVSAEGKQRISVWK